MDRPSSRRAFARTSLLSASALLLPRQAAGRIHLGLVTYEVAKDWDLDTLLRNCREAGLTGVEFRTTHAHGVERTLSPAQRAAVKTKCAEAGMLQTSLGSVCEFHSPDPAVVRRNVEDCREWVLLARDIGARAVKVRPNGLPSEVPQEKTLEQIGRALAECGSFASDHGVEIWLEAHGEGTRLPARMRRILDACRHPAVGITWNSNDTDVVNGSVAPSFALLRPFVRCCHITDLRSPYPYAELFRLLGDAGFTGYTLCEYPEPVPAEQGVEWLRAYRARWEALRRAASG
ncbi:MAG TPA: sugar phosphate isomerase/epimerase family protein [Vicinamibacteria bacterium]|nr:sugar phosphate isomerase/epimerase family protein [Vicinamibacteria bacterium]